MVRHPMRRRRLAIAAFTFSGKTGERPSSRLLIAMLVMVALMPMAAPAGAGVCERYMAAAAVRHRVPLGFLYAIGLTETGRRNTLSPWALNIHGKAVFARSRKEAYAIFRAARARGRRLIDMGCMQINWHYHGRNFPSAWEMLDPARNVDYAARFLRRLYEREGSWTMAAARYHAGPNNDPAQKRYVCTVIRNLVATGFGRWTPGARRFCAPDR